MQFRKRIKIAPGIQLNISKGGIGVTVGTKGMHYTIGSSGQHVSVGIPGTGAYYRKKIGKGGLGDTVDDLLGGKQDEAAKPGTKRRRKSADLDTEDIAPRTSRSRKSAAEYADDLKAEDAAPRTRRKSRHARTSDPQPEAAARELVAAPPRSASPAEQDFYEGALAYMQGDYRRAFDAFSRVVAGNEYLSDGLLMSGLSASYLDEYDTAIDSLVALIEQGRAPLPGDRDSLTAAYLPDATVSVPVTQFASVELPLGVEMATLLLVELLSAHNRHDEAIDFLSQLFNSNPHDQVLQLSIADIYSQIQDFDSLHQFLSEHPENIDTDDDVSLGLMYYWAVALTAKQFYDAADEAYTAAARKAKHNEELSKLIQYAHADLYEQMGNREGALKLFERLYGTEPGFYDVMQRVEALRNA